MAEHHATNTGAARILARELEQMAGLHSQCFWSVYFLEAATMIKSLVPPDEAARYLAAVKKPPLTRARLR